MVGLVARLKLQRDIRQRGAGAARHKPAHAAGRLFGVKNLTDDICVSGTDHPGRRANRFRGRHRRSAAAGGGNSLAKQAVEIRYRPLHRTYVGSHRKNASPRGLQLFASYGIRGFPAFLGGGWQRNAQCLA